MTLSKRFVIVPIALAVWTAWLTILSPSIAWGNLLENWQIAVTMAFGSIIAGATSLGGGAVAFPVFTKLLHIPPHDAKVFSLAIQSVGMGSATLAICLTGIKVDWRVIRWSTLGGFLGVFIGAGFIAPLLIPPAIKMSFTVMLASFAITLFALNQGMRECHTKMPVWTSKEKSILLIAGVIGGIMSGLVGNGIDIVVFSVMVLLFRIDEKVSTPTSVILMAVNAMAGFAFSVFLFRDFTPDAHTYWLAAIPVVVVGAPLGAVLCSLMRRETIANILIGLIFIELVTSLLLIPLTPTVIAYSLTILLLSSSINYWMYRTQVYELPFIKQFK
jgi:uncharacterized protein